MRSRLMYLAFWMFMGGGVACCNDVGEEFPRPPEPRDSVRRVPPAGGVRIPPPDPGTTPTSTSTAPSGPGPGDLAPEAGLGGGGGVSFDDGFGGFGGGEGPGFGGFGGGEGPGFGGFGGGDVPLGSGQVPLDGAAPLGAVLQSL